MTTNYEKGANFERQLVDYLEYHDFEVMRAAGSHGIVDVMAIPPRLKSRDNRPTWPILAQCKAFGDKYFDFMSLKALWRRTECHVLLVDKPDGQRKQPVFIDMPLNIEYTPKEYLEQKFGIIHPQEWYYAIKTNQESKRAIKIAKKKLDEMEPGKVLVTS